MIPTGDKMLTNRQIKNIARQRIKANGGNCISQMFFLFAVLVFIFFCEASIYLIFKNTGEGWLFDITLFFSNKIVAVYWSLKLMFYWSIITSVITINRRLFMDISKGIGYVDTRQYINAHTLEYYTKLIFANFILLFIKITAAVPLAIGIYGIYYWGWVCKLKELTAFGLLFFMMSIGFTAIWIFIWGYYCMSLILTPYIMCLNPKANIFDACDLSVRLMDGNHLRVWNFFGSFVKYTITLPLVYPFLAFFPYYYICYIILMEDIMGSYWQDKMPAIVKRWKKYQ